MSPFDDPPPDLRLEVLARAFCFVAAAACPWRWEREHFAEKASSGSLVSEKKNASLSEYSGAFLACENAADCSSSSCIKVCCTQSTSEMNEAW